MISNEPRFWDPMTQQPMPLPSMPATKGCLGQIKDLNSVKPFYWVILLCYDEKSIETTPLLSGKNNHLERNLAVNIRKIVLFFSKIKRVISKGNYKIHCSKESIRLLKEVDKTVERHCPTR
ncbi:hypothetical protein AVEN_5317-1 [Araneus ventricosus]|uniref:Uncharacterized protein n=1 Tax=Araneus ventricosus TaxID=182803 RepID=A0A4Y2VUK6_ARAVE|nr:hypothetical protein AVEN_5317-1 [Araneus ventricosus]